MPNTSSSSSQENDKDSFTHTGPDLVVLNNSAQYNYYNAVVYMVGRYYRTHPAASSTCYLMKYDRSSPHHSHTLPPPLEHAVRQGSRLTLAPRPKKKSTHALVWPYAGNKFVESRPRQPTVKDTIYCLLLCSIVCDNMHSDTISRCMAILQIAELVTSSRDLVPFRTYIFLLAESCCFAVL